MMMIRSLTVTAALVLLMAGPGAAQQTDAGASGVPTVVQGEWTAWFGCWRPVSEAPGENLVCVVPGAEALSARFLTFAGAELVDDALVRADAVGRRVEEGGCAGTETGSFSRDGRRIFVRTEMTCPGIDRVATSVLAFVERDAWVDTRGLTVAGQHAAEIVRYEAAGEIAVPTIVAALLPAGQGLARETARVHASAPLDTDAIVEAAALVPAPALDALLAVRGSGFPLDAGTLVHLERSGVAGSTIDVMVALSFPEAFAVRPSEAVRGAPVGPMAFIPPQCYSRSFSRRMYRGYCDYGFGYSPYGYGAYGYGYDPYDRWRFGSPIVVVVRPGDEVVPEAPTVAPGRGYTRGGAPGTGSAEPRSGGARSTTPQTSSAPASSSGGSSAQPASSGSSGSSSSGSTGRTAVPRGSSQ